MSFTIFMKWKCKLLFLGLSFSFFTLYSQTTIEKYIVIDEAYQLYPFAEEGFLIINSYASRKKKSFQKKYTFYDTNLNPVQEMNHKIPYGFWGSGNCSSSTHFHQLHTNKDKFLMTSVTVDSLKITEVTGVLSEKTELSDMRVMGDFVYFKGILNKEKCLYAINWKTGEKIIINIFIEEEKWNFTELYDYQLLEKSKELLMYVNVGSPKNRCQRFLLIANPLGERRSVIEISEGLEKDFIEMSATKIGPESYALVGTYTNRKILRKGTIYERYDRLKRTGEQNHTDEGVFFAKVKNGKVETVKFYDFLSIANFTDFIPEEKLQKAKVKNNKKGLFYNIFSTNFKMFSHEIEVKNDGYLLLTEVANTLFSPNLGRSFENRERFGEQYVFKGCDYQYAFIAKFDLSGALVWNKFFDFSLNFNPRKIKEVISIRQQSDNSWKLVFPNKDRIAITHIDANGQFYQTEQELPQRFNEINEAVGLHTWFGNNFLFSSRSYLISRKDKRRKTLPAENLLGIVKL